MDQIPRRRERVVKRPPSLRGEVTPPGDKSISHRAAILGSLGRERIEVERFSPASDCSHALSCLRALGVEVRRRGEKVAIRGVWDKGFSEPKQVLHAGNSGTTMRLLAGLLAAQPFLSILTGDSSLRSRPMDRVIRPLRLMGAQIWGRGGDSLPPLAIRGTKLRGIEYRLPVPSAQVKSAILLAGLFAEGETAVIEEVPSRDHTERMLRAAGARISREGECIRISPLSNPLSLPSPLVVPGDMSSAAFWIVAAALHPDAEIRIKGVGINPTRTGLIEVLREMGANIRVENERMEGFEPVADLVVSSSSLRGVEVGGEIIPRLIDEIVVLAVAASVASGRTVIRNAAELRVKETDRIAHTASELSKMGAKIEPLPDGFIIEGVPRLRGAICRSYGDHRLAMALAIAGLVAEGETIIKDSEVVKVSYPSFWEDLDKLCGWR